MNKPAETQEWQSKLTGKNVTPEVRIHPSIQSIQ
jgi:hypothetical protein